MQLDLDDLSWARPLVDEGRSALDRGEGLTLEEHRARITGRFGKLER